MENKLKELTDAIRNALPRLMVIEKGQIFHSKYYGDIVATRIGKHSEKVCSIYGFDLKDGLPRDNYYPRDIELVGKNPQLNDVLEWFLSIKNDSMLFTSTCGNIFLGLHKDKQIWDLSKPFLKDQSEDLINFLHSIIKDERKY